MHYFFFLSFFYFRMLEQFLDPYSNSGGHGCRVITLLPPTSEIGFQIPALPQVGKLVVACRWLAVYSTEPWPTVCIVQKSIRAK